MSTVDVIIPSLGRPARLAEALMSLRDAGAQLRAVSPISPRSGVGVIVVAEEPINQSVAAQCGARVLAEGGNAVQKWNAGAAASYADWFVLGADDLLFRPGWLDVALATDKGGYVGLRTQGSGAPEYAEHYMASRAFCIKHLGGCLVIPHYLSQYLDVEAWARAQRAGVAVSTAEIVAEHRHWANGGAPFDATYQLSRNVVANDDAMFLARRAAGFPDDFASMLAVPDAEREGVA
jgi:hypothetical protein